MGRVVALIGPRFRVWRMRAANIPAAAGVWLWWRLGRLLCPATASAQQEEHTKRVMAEREAIHLKSLLNAIYGRYAAWELARCSAIYHPVPHIALAACEWVAYGPRGYRPETLGTHPFKRWDISPLPEDIEVD